MPSVPRFLRREARPTEPAREPSAYERDRATRRSRPTRAIGRSGTVNTRGFIADSEKDAELRWPQNLITYEEMRRNDPSIKGSLALVQTPIRATNWAVEPAGQSAEQLEQAAWLEKCLLGGELEGGFDEFLRQALDYLTYGHMVFEMIAELRKVQFSYRDPDSDQNVDVEREGFVVCKLGVRLPVTIKRWIPKDNDTSQLKQIEQWLPDGNTPPTALIPADRLVILTHDRQGDDWRGVSLLRSAYLPYQYKRKLQNIEAIGLERSAGLPVAYPPEGTDPDDPLLDQMETVLKNIRQGEDVYVVMPGPKQGAGVNPGDGWLLEELSIKGDGKGAPFGEAIGRYEAEMSRNVLAEFMRLGHENTGARAVGDVQQDPYYQAVEAVTGYVEDVVHEQITKPLIDWNYEVAGDYPRLSSSKIQAKNIEVIGSYVSTLVSANALKPDAELEKWLRQLADAPEPSEGEANPSAPWEPWGSADEGAPPDEGAPAEGAQAPELTDEEFEALGEAAEALTQSLGEVLRGDDR